MVLPLAIFSVLIICSSWVFISFNTTLSPSMSLADGLYLIGGMLISTGVFGLSIYGWKNEYKKIMKENDRLLLEFKLSQITSELSITKDENRKKELEEEFNRLVKLKHLTN